MRLQRVELTPECSISLSTPPRLLQASLDIAEQEGIAVFYDLEASEVAGYAMTEVAIGDAAEALSNAEIETYVQRVVLAGR
jgi:hypothetical protein